jgi:Raf kinase inhibitor-like YbhB/YbcL family protein
VTPTPPPTARPRFALTSTAIDAGGTVPREYTCDGADVSPPLAWVGVPDGARALVLVVDDPDAAGFVHWTVLDIAASDGHLAKGISPTAASPQQGRNDFGRVGWGGPCPPSGTHHYRFTLSALAAPLGLGDHPGSNAVRAALARATVVGRASLAATYRRP